MAAPQKPRSGSVHNDLFEKDEPELAPDGPVKPFVQHLRETPPAPLSSMMKLVLWIVGGLTVLLFLGSLLKLAN